MINIPAFTFSLGKSLISFLPLTIAPFLIGNSDELISFYKIVLVYSILSSGGSLGLSNFFYAISCSNFSQYSRLKVLNNYFNIIKIFVGFVFFLIFTILILFRKYDYLYSLSFLPLGAYLIVKAQVNLGVGNLRGSFFAFAIPSFLFCASLLTKYFFQTLSVQVIIFGYFLVFNLLIFNKFRFYSVKFFLGNARFFELWGAKKQIANGLIVSVLPPLVSLRVLDYLNLHYTDNTTILMYYLLNRILDATVSFAIIYVMALGLKNLYVFKKFSNIKNILFVFLIFIFYFIVCNLYLYFVLNRFDLHLASIEILNGLVRFCLGLLSVFYITKIPLMIAFKEVLITFCVFVFLLILSAGSFTQFQFAMLFCYTLSLLILIYYIRTKRI
jgi:hypothetical protein